MSRIGYSSACGPSDPILSVAVGRCRPCPSMLACGSSVEGVTLAVAHAMTSLSLTRRCYRTNNFSSSVQSLIIPADNSTARAMVRWCIGKPRFFPRANLWLGIGAGGYVFTDRYLQRGLLLPGDQVLLVSHTASTCPLHKELPLLLEAAEMAQWLTTLS